MATKQKRTRRDTGNPKASKSKNTKGKKGHFKTPKNSRDVVHPEVTSKICSGEESMTADQAMELLGWEEVNGAASHFQDLDGKKIRCDNNDTNRPLYMSNVKTIMQDILRGKFYLNCENMIIGRTGQVLNAQHRLIALVFASQAWAKDKAKYKEHWPNTPPTIETLLALGANEDDIVVNTMDTAKPRTLANVLYRHELLADLKPHIRIKVARYVEWAIKMLWFRTGAKVNAFGVLRTHSESLEFIDRHPRILECVKHVAEEDGKDNKIKMWLPVGAAGALLYLMSAGNSSLVEYQGSDKPGEDTLNWDLYDDACDFWVELAGGGAKLKPLRSAMVDITDTDGGGSFAERCALIIKAWNCLVDGNKITPGKLKLEYEIDEAGFSHMSETPTLGGIDVGDPKEAEVATEDDDDSSPEKSKGKANAKKFKPGTKWIINEPNEDEWTGTLVSLIGGNATIKDQDGDDWTIETKFLQPVE
jgi:hypothetical protein